MPTFEFMLLKLIVGGVRHYSRWCAPSLHAMAIRKKLVNSPFVRSEEQLRRRTEKRMMREYRNLLYESVFWELEYKKAVSKDHRKSYEEAFWNLYYNKLSERARKETIERLREGWDSIRRWQPLPLNDRGRPCIRIFLRGVLSGDTRQALFPVGTTYYQFFNLVRVQFGFDSGLWSPIYVAGTQLSGTPVEGNSEQDLEKELHDSTLLCRFYGVST